MQTALEKFLSPEIKVETSIHLHGSWLVLIRDIQTNSGVIFTNLVDNRKCWNLTLKLTPIISSVHVDD